MSKLRPRLSLADVESTYDRLAEAIDNAPPGKGELLLVKLALLLADEVGDGGRVAELIAAAEIDLNDDDTPGETAA